MELRELPERGLGNKVTEIIEELSRNEPRLGSPKSLGPMMSEPSEAALKAFLEFLNRNLNDPEFFRISARISHEVISMVNTLLHNPGGSGMITYGGSESNLTALYIAREMGRKVVLTPRTAHLSVVKSAKLLGMELIKVGLDEDFRVSLTDLKAKLKEVSDSEAVVFLNAGNTEFGRVDNARAVYEEFPDIPIIVDAAFGGFVIPFLNRLGYSLPTADFRVPSVIAMSVDGHKTGYTPIPSGALLLRDESLLNYVSFPSPYLHSDRQVGILWTRTAASAASLWASLLYYGIDGFTKIVGECMRNSIELYRSLLELGFQAVKPELPIVCFKHQKMKHDYLLRELRRRGWYVYSCPTYGGIKVTVMKHVTKEVVEEFLETLEEITKRL